MSLLILIGPALAQEEVCAGTLPTAEWREAMDAVDEALAALDGARADRVLDDIVHELRCLGELAEPADLGRLARQVSLVAFWQQDNEEMQTWGLLARKTLGGTPWPEALPVPDRYFELMDAVDLPTPTLQTGRGVDAPGGGALLLDGWQVGEPASEAMTQHLLQVADKKGRVLSTEWMDGTRWPEVRLSDDPSPLEAPTWYVAPPAPPPWSPERPPVSEAPDDGGEDVGDGVADAPDDPLEPDPPPDAPVESPEVPSPAPDAAVSDGVDDPSDATLGKLQLLEEREQRRGRQVGTVTFDGDGRDESCPWKGEPRKVEATRREVTINRHVFPIRTDEDHAAFRKTLRGCGEYRAARRFKRWQEAEGLFSSGAQYRDAMVDALLSEEPSRRR